VEFAEKYGQHVNGYFPVGKAFTVRKAQAIFNKCILLQRILAAEFEFALHEARLDGGNRFGWLALTKYREGKAP
jgi:hypothetical protein